MLATLPRLLRIPLAMLLLALNILLHVAPLFAFTLVKVIVPVRAGPLLVATLMGTLTLPRYFCTPSPLPTVIHVSLLEAV